MTTKTFAWLPSEDSGSHVEQSVMLPTVDNKGDDPWLSSHLSDPRRLDENTFYSSMMLLSPYPPFAVSEDKKYTRMSEYWLSTVTSNISLTPFGQTKGYSQTILLTLRG